MKRQPTPEAAPFIQIRELLQHVFSFMDLPIQFVGLEKINPRSDLHNILLCCKAFHLAMINYENFRKRFYWCRTFHELSMTCDVVTAFDKTMIEHRRDNIIMEPRSSFRVTDNTPSFFERFFLRKMIIIPDEWNYTNLHEIQTMFRQLRNTSLTDEKKFSALLNDLDILDELKKIMMQAEEKIKNSKTIVTKGVGGIEFLFGIFLFGVSIPAFFWILCKGVDFSRSLLARTTNIAVSSAVCIVTAIVMTLFIEAYFVLCGCTAELCKKGAEKHEQICDAPVFSNTSIGRQYESSCQFFDKRKQLFEKLDSVQISVGNVI